MADLNKKEFVSKADASDPLVYVMSDDTVDRVGDVIEAKGWRLGNFLKNPIALFGHQHNFVIGHWTDVKVKGGQLVGRLNLLPKGISERLDEIRAAVEAGVLRAVSVGFTSEAEDVEPMKSGGIRFRGAELMECSLVAVPANPNALQMAKSLNLSDDAKSLIFAEGEGPGTVHPAETIFRGKECFDPRIEIPSEPEPQPEGKRAVVVRLGKAASDEAPFVIRKIHPAKPAGS